ncbi:DUF3365 domain-containing protein [uncultured Psychroserpens sp.]|uniref:Tll0287-like domain-containing protein n=1 Tax=uncultured Psychroserpens sp. TaxID=255436 RepID=UPI002611F7DD|nr:DUF3365 domain-containing protein [uncultured Psychroserpens sp.]
MRTTLLSILSLVFVFSCKNTKEVQYVSYEQSTTKDTITHPGKKLLETNCYICHSPTASHDDRIGPPMIAVKKHYLEDGMTKEEFVSALQNWIKNPTEENVKMKGAVRRFGIMPKQAFPEETINQIGEYLYEFEIDQPEWFEDHFNSEKGKHQSQGQGKGKGKGKGGKGHGNGMGNGKHKQQVESDFENLPFGERGLKYALTTKSVLGKNLMSKLQNEGTLKALEFCNSEAYPLTDSMALVHNAVIKRASDKPRNPNNTANSEELNYIKEFKRQLLNEQEIKPIVSETDDKVNVYYPIITNSMCLQCHGKPKTMINVETLNTIAKLYPKDKAIGYDINEVRGIWSVSFEK